MCLFLFAVLTFQLEYKYRETKFSYVVLESTFLQTRFKFCRIIYLLIFSWLSQIFLCHSIFNIFLFLCITATRSYIILCIWVCISVCVVYGWFHAVPCGLFYTCALLHVEAWSQYKVSLSTIFPPKYLIEGLPRSLGIVDLRLYWAACLQDLPVLSSFQLGLQIHTGVSGFFHGFQVYY